MMNLRAQLGAFSLAALAAAGPLQPSAPPALAALRQIDSRTSPDVQIALAMTAGPGVGRDATIYVLGPTGYARAREGSNGFSCLVTRERADTLEPECFDAEGSATTLRQRLFVEQQRALGQSEAEIERAVEAGYRAGTLVAPRKPGLVYMMSEYNYVFDPERRRVIHFPGHLMFYAPYATAKDVGSGPGAPYLVHPGKPDALMIVVPAGHHP